RLYTDLFCGGICHGDCSGYHDLLLLALCRKSLCDTSHPWNCPDEWFYLLVFGSSASGSGSRELPGICHSLVWRQWVLFCNYFFHGGLVNPLSTVIFFGQKIT